MELIHAEKHEDVTAETIEVVRVSGRRSGVSALASAQDARPGAPRKRERAQMQIALSIICSNIPGLTNAPEDDEYDEKDGRERAVVEMDALVTPLFRQEDWVATVACRGLHEKANTRHEHNGLHQQSSAEEKLSPCGPGG